MKIVVAILLSIVALRAEARAAEQLRFPDPVVVNQRGESIRFYSQLIKDKVVVLDFIFTSCTIVCRPLTSNVRKVRAELDKDLPNQVQFVSVSVDSDRDTPPVLASFARTFHLPADWSLVTGSKSGIDQILKASGVYTIDPNYHSARVVVGSEAAGWSRFYGLSSPALLTQAIREAVRMRKERLP